MKKTAAALIIAAIISICPIRSHAVGTSAESAILIEAQSGDVLYEKDADTRRGLASTTKIMTALIAIENCDLDKIVEVSPMAVGIEGSSAYLYAGEKITMESLLYALLLQSANDAAAAIAYEVGGGIDGFCAMMNEKAESLGLVNTHFSNPHGLDDEMHYTTARELAMIARAAMENETFCQVVSTVKKAVPMEDGGATRVFINHNRLLRCYDDIVGVKTGYTKKCGRTLVSASDKDGMKFIAVTLCDGDDWRDHRALHDYGQSLYERVKLIGRGEGFEVSSRGESVFVGCDDDVYATLPRVRGEIKAVAEYSSNGGEVNFYLGEKLVGRAELHGKK